MEEVKVSIVPAGKGSGAFKVTLHQRHDAASVLQHLKTRLGGGELEDPQAFVVLSDPDEELEGGVYTFTPDNVLHGKMQGVGALILCLSTCCEALVLPLAGNGWSESG